MTIHESAGGNRLVDELAFGPGGDGEPPSGALTENGDFERGLSFWETSNDVSVSGITHLGSGAARIGAGSSITFRRPLFPGSPGRDDGNPLHRGNAGGQGRPLLLECGGRMAHRRVGALVLLTSSYQDFHFFANTPEGTAQVTIWVRNDADGAVTVDDLGLVYVPESPGPAPRSPDTGFEDGFLEPWSGAGNRFIDGTAPSGTKAATLDGPGFLGTTARPGPAKPGPSAASTVPGGGLGGA